MGRIRRIARRTVARTVDTVGRRFLRRHESWPSPSLWDMTVNDRGHLTVSGYDMAVIAEACGTPLHVVNGERLARNFHRFRDAFRSQHPHVEIGYSYKTNPVPGVLQRLHAYGAWAEVISHFELWLALRLGVPPSRIVFNGPGKTRDALDLAVSHNIALINIDGPGEIDTIETLADKHGVRQAVGIRVVTTVGWSDQFGFAIHDGSAHEAARRVNDRPHLALQGLHLHLGTGIAAIETYLTGIRQVMRFAQSLRRDVAARLKYVDLGGGFAVPTVRKFSPLDEILLHHALPAWPPDLGGESMVDRHARDIVAAVLEGFPGDGPIIIFEPGRAITSSAQTLVLGVIARKDLGRPVPALILDGGRNVAMPPAWQYHALVPVNKASARGAGYYDIFGPLCHPGELLFRTRWLPDMHPGDLLAIMDAGAYFVPNQTNFSNARPPAVMVENEGWKVIRVRESFEDVTRLDVLAPESSS